MIGRRFGDADIHAYLDGEMPAEEHADFRAWLEQNPAEQQRLDAFGNDQKHLRAELDSVLAEPIPQRLTRELRRVAGKRPPAAWRRIAAAIVIFALGGGAGWFAGQRVKSPESFGSRTVEQALNAHRVYVAEALHAVEVGADQKPHLVKWLSNRLGRPLSAPALQDVGFELVGGRLLPSDDAAAAQFMYEDAAGERVTLYIAVNPTGGKTAFKLTRSGDTHTFFWLDGALGYALSGDIGEDRLQQVAKIVYRQLMDS